MSSFDALVGGAATGTVQAPADWMQGRTAFGGLVTTIGKLWASDGRHLGWMEQLVAVYDKV